MKIFARIKSLILWGLVGLSLSWLLSCQPNSSSSSQEIEFWTMQLQPQFTPYFNDLIAKFEAENQGTKVRWVDIPWEAMESKILTAVSAKTAPDIVNLNPNFASQLASRNAWLDINSQISPDIQKRYLAKIWQSNILNNQTFAIPWYLTTPITIYNLELLKQAGTNQAPKTYDELAKVAQAVKEKTGKYAFFATFVPGDSNEVLESLVQMGTTLIDDQGKAAFNTAEGVAAFRYWVDLYQKGLLPPEVLTQGHRHGIELYQGGEIALLATGAEFIKTIANNAPDIYDLSASSSQITGKTGKKNVAVMNLVIPRDTDQVEKAVKFALFVTDTSNQLSFAKAAKVLPSTVEGVEQYLKELEQNGAISKEEQALKVSALQLRDAEVLVPPIENISRLQRLIYENLQAAMLKEKTVEQAIADAAREWDKG
jgi:putative chitobiose transport system substrate-binding protein